MARLAVERVLMSKLSDLLELKTKKLAELQEEINETKKKLEEERKSAFRFVSQQAANEAIAIKLACIDSLLNECKEIARVNDTTFSFYSCGYGMGGWYGKNSDGHDDGYGWSASSQSC